MPIISSQYPIVTMNIVIKNEQIEAEIRSKFKSIFHDDVWVKALHMDFLITYSNKPNKNSNI